MAAQTRYVQWQIRRLLESGTLILLPRHQPGGGYAEQQGERQGPVEPLGRGPQPLVVGHGRLEPVDPAVYRLQCLRIGGAEILTAGDAHDLLQELDIELGVPGVESEEGLLRGRPHPYREDAQAFLCGKPRRLDRLDDPSIVAATVPAIANDAERCKNKRRDASPVSRLVFSAPATARPLPDSSFASDFES